MVQTMEEEKMESRHRSRWCRARRIQRVGCAGWQGLAGQQAALEQFFSGGVT